MPKGTLKKIIILGENTNESYDGPLFKLVQGPQSLKTALIIIFEVT